MDRETLHKFDLADGQIRENVTVEGLEFLGIKQGDRLQLGDDVILEITGLCDPCPRMDEIRDGLRDELEGQRGLLAYSEMDEIRDGWSKLEIKSSLYESIENIKFSW